MNTVILAGKVSNINKDNNTFTLLVDRNYRNDEGVIETDAFTCKSWGGMNNYLSNYLNIDDILIVKGQIRNDSNSYTILIDQFSIMHRPNKKITT